MTLLATDEVVTNSRVRHADDGPGDPDHEELSALERLVRLLASSYSKMPLFP
jgi:hypothetical protein